MTNKRIIIDIHSVYRNHFFETLAFAHIKAAAIYAPEISQRQVVRDFLDCYGLNDDGVNIDTVIKGYQRRCEEYKNMKTKSK
jgi:hypothetical protein